MRLVYGPIGKVRIPLLACVYQAIRKTFATEGPFAGLEEDVIDTAHFFIHVHHKNNCSQTTNVIKTLRFVLYFSSSMFLQRHYTIW